MRPLMLVLPVIALAACERAEPPKVTAAAEAPAASATPDVRRQAPFVGRWAASPELCADGAWVFRTDGVSTAGEVSCRFASVEPSASGYRIAAACSHEGSESEGEIGLSITDPAPPESMTVSGGPWNGPVTLRRCPA
ncbi:hypothetical protein LRS10_20705 [Phenylobacterium sp. J426]|uniref:hypothetical protein n=1 Tax=Phenylobacterium sp. J426 TaxID=2898439 RepID=UPI0021515792|nr:hypothetical protein [Phenylobacterium sp. J426]MCR5876350.1 hypothetical protein [Phenylobacterium sp. J426]